MTLKSARCRIDYILTYSSEDVPSRPPSQMGGPFDGAPNDDIYYIARDEQCIRAQVDYRPICSHNSAMSS